MSKLIDIGKAEQILLFIHTFSSEHGFGPTIREICKGVGLHSTSTVHGYLERLTKARRITSIPGTPRSIRVVDQHLTKDTCNDGSVLLLGKFRFPEGTYPVSIIAMVTDGDQNRIFSINAENMEILKAN